MRQLIRIWEEALSISRSRLYRAICYFLLLCATGLAQTTPPAGPLMAVAYYKVKPDHVGDFVGYFKRHIQPVLETLAAQGVVLAWRLDANELHHSAEATHSLWFTLPDYAALDKLAAARQQAEQESLKHKKGEPELIEEMTDPEQHHDQIFRAIAEKRNPVSAGVLPWTVVSKLQVQPGKEDEYESLWRKYQQPLYEKLLAAGTILSFGRYEESLASVEPQWRWIVITAPDSAAGDKIAAAWRAEESTHSAEELFAIRERMRAAIVETSPHDDLLHAVMDSAR